MCCRVIRDHGPSSRAEVVRGLGLERADGLQGGRVAPQRHGCSRRWKETVPVIGRPAMKLRLATASAQVLGIVIDVNRCSVVATGLDGELRESGHVESRRVDRLRRIDRRPGRACACLDGTSRREDARRRGDRPRADRPPSGPRHPLAERPRDRWPLAGRDLGEQLGLECVMIQDQHALCMAERHFGQAKGLDDFAILDVSSGVGMGVMSGGRLVRGHSGFAGEIGHITVAAQGPSSAAAATAAASKPSPATPRSPGGSPSRLGRPIDIDELIRLARAGELDLDERCKEVVALPGDRPGHRDQRLQPVHSVHPWPALRRRRRPVRSRSGADQQAGARPRRIADCRIIRARGSKKQGAIAGIIQHLDRFRRARAAHRRIIFL